MLYRIFHIFRLYSNFLIHSFSFLRFYGLFPLTAYVHLSTNIRGKTRRWTTNKYAQPQIMTNHSAEIAKALAIKKNPNQISRIWFPGSVGARVHPLLRIETTQNTSRVCVCVHQTPRFQRIPYPLRQKNVSRSPRKWACTFIYLFSDKSVQMSVLQK